MRAAARLSRLSRAPDNLLGFWSLVRLEHSEVLSLGGHWRLSGYSEVQILHYYQYDSSIGTSESKHLFRTVTVRNALWQAVNVLILARTDTPLMELLIQ
jgi:hypothetical protein